MRTEIVNGDTHYHIPPGSKVQAVGSIVEIESQPMVSGGVLVWCFGTIYGVLVGIGGTLLVQWLF